jgi:hypothetical protein
MRRLLFAVVAVGVLFNAGVSYAQDEELPSIPKKVQAMFSKQIGNWTVSAEGKPIGATVIRWGPGQRYIILEGEFRDGDKNISGLLSWDGVSEDGFIMRGVTSTGHWIDRMKILSDSVAEGAMKAVRKGKRTSSKFRIKIQGSDQIAFSWTQSTTDGEKQPDESVVYNRVKPTTRKDFKEFCRLNEGAWVGKVPLRQDVPGLGKKGEIATAHYDYTIVEDGSALFGRSYWPDGTSTWFMAYDETNQKIISIGASAVFGVNHPTLHYRDRTWICEGGSVSADNSTITGTFSDDGKTLTVHVDRTDDGVKSEFTDVWHRMNK